MLSCSVCVHLFIQYSNWHSILHCSWHLTWPPHHLSRSPPIICRHVDTKRSTDQAAGLQIHVNLSSIAIVQTGMRTLDRISALPSMCRRSHSSPQNQPTFGMEVSPMHFTCVALHVHGKRSGIAGLPMPHCQCNDPLRPIDEFGKDAD